MSMVGKITRRTFLFGAAALGALLAGALGSAPRSCAPHCAALLLGLAAGAPLAAGLLGGPGAPSCLALAAGLLSVGGALASAKGSAVSPKVATNSSWTILTTC